MSSDERKNPESASDPRSSISSTIHDLSIDVEKDASVTELQRKYAAAQVAAAQANSRFSSAHRRASELAGELLEQSELLKRQTESLELLTADKFRLEEEVASLRGRIARLKAETTALRTQPQSGIVSSAENAEFSDAQAEIAHLQQLLAQKDAQFQAVVQSMSFRIGRRITSVLRLIPGVDRRQE